jgi:hypothetical protein
MRERVRHRDPGTTPTSGKIELDPEADLRQDISKYDG